MKQLFENEQEKATLLTQLNLLGAKEVVVEFTGGGDDGQVDSTYYIDVNGDAQNIPQDMIAWTKMTYGTQEKITEKITLIDVLEDVCYRALDGTGLDWYNNEGGQGNLRIDLRESPVKTTLYVGINTTTTDDHEFDLDEEME